MGTASVMHNTASGHMAVRVLVALYTVASATGLITGTNLSLLLTPLMPEIAAQTVMTALVTALCTFMLLGVKRRAMALLLAIVFLWSSYFAILGPNAEIFGGSHWRDMMLIAALLLIYADAINEEHNDLSALARAIKNPRSITSYDPHSEHDTPSQPDLKVRRTSQTLFHNDLDELGRR